MAGFTTVRDVGTFRAFVDIALRDAIDAGWTPGPRMFCAGAYVTSSTGGGDIPGLAVDVDERLPRDLRFGVANSPDEVRKVVREILHRGAAQIKVIATGAVLTEGTNPGAPEFSEEEIRAAVEEAALYGTYVAAHAHGPEGIKRAVRAGVGSIEHGIADGRRVHRADGRARHVPGRRHLLRRLDRGGGDARRLVAELLRKNRETTDAQREGFEKCVKAGVKIAYGTDSGVYPHKDVGRQFAYMVRHGMTPIQAIRSATIVAAELLGRAATWGRSSPGSSPTSWPWPATRSRTSPCSRTSPFVMKGGEVVKDARG